jgi:hypothetical protein
MCEIDEAEMETTFLGGGANASDGNGGWLGAMTKTCMAVCNHGDVMG